MSDADRLVTTGIVCMGIGAAMLIAVAAAGLFRRLPMASEDQPKRLTDEDVRVRYPFLHDRMGRGARRS